MTLRERAEAVLSSDTAIASELLAMADRNVLPAPAVRAGIGTSSIRAFVEGRPGWAAAARSGIESDARFQVEAVVLAHGRPSMLVQRNRIVLPESPELRRRIEATRALRVPPGKCRSRRTVWTPAAAPRRHRLDRRREPGGDQRARGRRVRGS